MAEKIVITFVKAKQQLVNEVTQALHSKGIDFELVGDTLTFNGFGVSGSCIFKQCEMEITITKKPFLMPMSLVTSKIRSYFG